MRAYPISSPVIVLNVTVYPPVTGHFLGRVLRESGGCGNPGESLSRNLGCPLPRWGTDAYGQPRSGFGYRAPMAQIIVYGHRESLGRRRTSLKKAIHGAVMAALEYPADKCFQRFIGLDDEDFIHPEDRGADYTIIEISMFEGRSDDAKRTLIAELFKRVEVEAGIAPHSLEITITETPKVNWGIRGANAADLTLGYKVEV